MADRKEQEDIEMVPDAEAGEPRSGGDPALKIEKLRVELAEAEAGRKEYLDGWQRAKADLVNYKKDEARRFEEFARFAAESVIAEVVQVLDSFDVALTHAIPKDVEKGIILIRSQLEDILRRHGLEMMQSSGEKFNPAYHESMGEVESDGKPGIVVEELQRGYLLNGKVLRPARVKISKQ